MNIKEQIENLPLDIFTRQRIMELTILAQQYDLINHISKFNLPQAFSWKDTREGGDYWLSVFIELEKYEYEKNQKSSQKGND